MGFDFFEMYTAIDQQQKSGRVQKGTLECQFGHEYLSLEHGVLVLFMLFLMADLTALNYVTDRFCRGI